MPPASTPHRQSRRLIRKDAADHSTHRAVQRSPWRQRVVEVERGFTAGFRANSALFFYFFTTSILVSVAIVLGLTSTQWALTLLSVTTAIASELLYYSINRVRELLAEQLTEEIGQLLAMGTAACTLLILGAISTICIILGTRLYALYG